MIAAYPELRQLFGAYLNADVGAAYGSIAAALAAYRAETGAEHRSAALHELLRLRAAAPNRAAFADALTALGCEIAFATPDDAQALGDAILETVRA